ncbi:MAG: PepSY-like domain-containing protein [Bacteroidales bacterium]|nr:PepSY-like domain-containing protein [Bacteroidales bacterium]
MINWKVILSAVCCTLIMTNGAFAQKGSEEQKKKVAKKSATEQVDPTLISADKLPEGVARTFKKRFASATDVQWHNSGDTVYTACYTMKESSVESDFGASGYWISTTESMDPESLLSSCYKTIALYYPVYKIRAAYKITRSDKNNQFLVHITEGKQAKTAAPVKMYLDKSGKLINIIEPEEQQSKEEYVDKKAQKEEAKLKKEFESDRQMDIYPAKIDGSELPNGIQKWVDKNYPDYIFKKVDYVVEEEFADEGNIYRIIIQRNGINQPHATVWFTRDGNFLKLVDEYREIEQTAERTKVEKREVSEAFKNAFALQYPDMTAQWEEWDEGWKAVFNNKYGKNTAYYDNQAQWQYTRNEMDYAKVPYAVRTAVETAYPKGEVVHAYKVTAPEVKPYYTLEVYLKKDKSTQEVDLMQNGKPLQ